LAKIASGQGERCMAISLAIAVGDTGDALVEKLIPLLHNQRITDDRKLDAGF
jgi:malonate-semialdehyde dehydrogenase (acetylating)/methylmalonate-semialdehyde dehydrogenase